MLEKINHIFISDSSWNHPKIRYRRHRLADYIRRQDDTADLLWVYPVSATPRRSGSYAHARQILSMNPHLNDSGIQEWALPDFIPGRFMKFISGFGNPQFKKLRDHICSYAGKKVLWYTYPLYPYIAKMLNWEAVVYDCSDLWVEPSGGRRSKTFSAKFASGLIDTAEKNIINESNVIFASSDFLAERVKMITGRQAIVIENGVDPDYFIKSKRLNKDPFENIPYPRLGYMGAMRSKIDFALLNELAVNNPDWNIVLIGPSFSHRNDDFNRLNQRKNVYWTGEVKTELIPDYLRNLDLGLLPYREIEYNRAVFPIKFYEYLSQGLPVVGCGVPATEKYAENGIYLHVGRENFEAACREVLSWVELKNDEYKSRRSRLAQQACWDNRLSDMVNRLRIIIGRKSNCNYL